MAKENKKLYASQSVYHYVALMLFFLIIVLAVLIDKNNILLSHYTVTSLGVMLAAIGVAYGYVFSNTYKLTIFI